MFTAMFIIFLFLLSSASAQADVFRWEDNNGNTHFSDQTHSGAKKLYYNSGYTYHSIKKVYDGDTILLSNGSKVRFLGINTPEVEGRNKSAQAGGEEAKQWLKNGLKNKKVRLEIDIEKHDKYSRLLAHVFTEDNQHINFELVKRGLATVNIHPPNLKYTADLLKAEQQAEKNQLGIWKKKEYKTIRTDELNRSNYKGWHRVIGNLKNIRRTKKYSHLKLSESFSLKINNQSLDLFPELDRYQNKSIEVRGWINKRKKQYSMYIRHPSQIKFN